MASQSTYEEVLRLVLETEGEQGVARMRAALEDLGDVDQATAGKTKELADALTELNEKATAADRYSGMLDELQRLQTAFDENQAAAYQLALKLGETEKPSKALLATQKQLAEQGNKLSASLNKQWQAVAKADTELDQLGVNAAELVAEQDRLRGAVGRASGALVAQAGAVQAQARASRELRQRLEEGDEAFRKQAEATRAASESLAAYRERSAAAAAANNKLGSSFGTFDRLRGLIAPLTAFLSFDAARRGVQNLFGVAAAAENARRALSNMYGSQAAGNKAYDELAVLAKRNGLAFNDLLEVAKTLKSFGLDPLNGSLQALVDQNAAVGGSQEDLAGKVLALGQAWAKQKLQGEEILQLVERGVPVWDLLQKATGKNVDELQKLSSAGALGRDVIAQLYQEIGRENAGAASGALFSLSGIVDQLSARLVGFKNKVVELDLGDYFKTQLQSLLASTGGLDGLAGRVSGAIIATLESVRKLGQQLAPLGALIGNVTLGIARHAEAVVFLGKVYIALKLSAVANQFLAITSATRAAAVATGELAAAEAARGAGVGKLGGLLSALPKVVKVAVLVEAIDFAVNSVIKLNDALGQYQDTLSKTEQYQVTQRLFAQEQLQRGQQMQSLYKSYADQQIASADALSAKTKEQSQDYAFALQQARAYFQGVVLEARGAGDATQAALAADKARELGEAVEAVQKHLQDLNAQATKNTAIRDSAQAAIDKFDELRTKGTAVSEALKDAFDGIDFTSTGGIEKAAYLVEQIGARGSEAAQKIQAELRAVLQGVAAEDLPRVRAAADEAFARGVTGADQLRAAIDSINLARLGVDLEQVRTGFTKAGRAAVDQFVAANDEVKRLGLTMEQRSSAIAQAFNSAFKAAGTSKELAALKRALADALSAGNLKYGDFAQAIDQIDGKFKDVASSATTMGQTVEQGVGDATGALRELAGAAQEAAGSADALGDSAEGAASRLDTIAQQSTALTFSIGEVSDAWREAFDAFGENAVAGSPVLDWFASLLNELTKQRKELQGMTADLDKVSAAYDENARRRAELKQQFNYISDSEIDAYIQKENQVTTLRKQRADQEKQAAEEQRKANEDRLKLMQEADAAERKAGDAAAASEQTLVIDWRAPSRSVAASASAAELEQAERLSALVAPLVLQRIERSRSTSIRRAARQ